MKTTIPLVLLSFLALCTIAFASIEPTEQSTTEQLIVVDTLNHQLYLYETHDNEKVLIETFSIASPKKGIVRPHGEGFVTAIEIKPWWYPTESTKKDYLERGIVLPDAIPPGHRLNAMGTAKIVLSHTTVKGSVYRIHGTENEASIGQDSSRGCIRMKNEDIDRLVNILVVGTKVIIN